MASRWDAQAPGEVGVALEAPETHPLAQDCEQAGGGGRKVCVSLVCCLTPKLFP